MTAAVAGPGVAGMAAGFIQQVQLFWLQRGEPVANVAGEVQCQEGSFSWRCRAR